MSRSVVTAVSDRWEGVLVTTLERGTDARIARRCPDLADLLAVAGSGLAEVALVSADLRSLDLTALDRLRECSVAVVGIYPPGDEQAELHLRQLGISTVIPADASAEVLQDALDALYAVPDTRLDAEATWSAQGEQREAASDAHNDVQDDLHPDVAEPLGTIIAVWGPAGAPGRTVVALNLASELARLGQSTVLVDADTYGGCIAQSLSLLDEAPGLAAATRSADQGTLDLAALARLAPEVSAGLRVLTGIPKAERWPELRAAALEHVLTLTRRLGRFTVIDCGFSLEDDLSLIHI